MYLSFTNKYSFCFCFASPVIIHDLDLDFFFFGFLGFLDFSFLFCLGASLETFNMEHIGRLVIVHAFQDDDLNQSRVAADDHQMNHG